MKSLESFAKEKLNSLEIRKLRRKLFITQRKQGAKVYQNGRQLTSFSCNDYLGLSHHPKILEAIQDSCEENGTGAGASRLVTGNHSLYNQLELRLAQMKGTEDACVFGSGYLANLGVIPTIVGPKDLILADEWSHACLLSGSSLAASKLLVFRHNDANHLEKLLESNRTSYQRALILTDGVFSMDGDLAPLSDLTLLAHKFDAWLMTDDAHGIGVVGNGRGSSFINPLPFEIPLQMGTLSKAIGSYGGYLCASRAVIDLIKTRARTLIYSTALPPHIISASIKAIDIIENNPELVATPLSYAQMFTSELGLTTATSAIVPLILGEPSLALHASSILREAGYLVTPIRPPTVPEGTARLRFTFSADHKIQDIKGLIKVVNDKILPLKY